jgi:hypothetical protein
MSVLAPLLWAVTVVTADRYMKRYIVTLRYFSAGKGRRITDALQHLLGDGIGDPAAGERVA